MTYRSKNNAKSKLAAPINATALSITVQTGDGDLFPVITAGDFTLVTLENSAGNREIIKISARAAASDTFTIDTLGRGQEGTTARSWSTGDVVSLRLTSGLLDISIAHPDNPTDAHDASAISNIPHGNVASTDVQSAINELDSEKFDVTNTLAATSKATPVDADVIGLIDSVSGLLNKLSWLNLKATLKTYFDSVYLSISTILIPIGSYLIFAGIQAPAGFLVCPIAQTNISRTTYAALWAALHVESTVTLTIASPGVFTWAANPLANGYPVVLSTTGALPTGFTAGTTYYVVNWATNSFQLSATVGGAAINSSGSQSGIHTATCAPWGIGNGTTTFGMPWFPPDYVIGQANANMGTNWIGAVLSHTHTVNGASQTGSGGSAGIGTAGTATGQTTTSQSPTGAAANYAASVRSLICVKY